MTDYRLNFIRDLETGLSSTFDAAQISLISNIAVKALSDYEITERCTDLVPLDDFNEKIIKRYTASLIVDGKSKGTIKQYARTCNCLSDLIHKPFNEMNTYDLRFFLAKELERGISSSYLENTRAYISAFFQWLTDEELIVKNPASKISTIKVHQEIEKEFSPVEIDTIRSACETERDRALIEVLLSTGIRVAELAALNVQDIDFRDLSVHVKHGKGDKERITFISQVAIQHLYKYLNSRPETGEALFYNKDHKPLHEGGIRKLLKRIEKRTDVTNIHPHRFRKTFATNLYKRGMPIQEIQKLLGHSNINTTMVYIVMDNASLQASYNKHIA